MATIFRAFVLIALPLMVSTVTGNGSITGRRTSNEGDVTNDFFKFLRPWKSLSDPVSKECNNDFQEYMLYLYGMIHSSPMKAPLWAYQLLDASGKPGTGILDGSIQWLGSFTECLKINVSKDNSTEVRFKGQYCTGDLVIPAFTPDHQMSVGNHVQQTAKRILDDLHRDVQGSSSPIPVTLALCMPSSCSALELHRLINKTLIMFNITDVEMKLSENKCYVKEATEYSTGSIIFIVVLACFALLLAIGTLYEVVNIMRTTKDNPDGDVNIIRETDKSTLERVLVSFSVYKNGRKILDASHGEGTLACLHGIRFFSMAWVVLGHSYASAAILPFKNLTDLPSIVRVLAFDVVTNAFFSVDNFFFISGFLVAYLFIREMKKTGGEFGPYRIFLFYFHRYWRLTPALAIGVAFVAELYKYLENGPAWKAISEPNVKTCQDYWWRNVLYIQNFFDASQMCFGVSWYLACDMQFYVVSLLIIYPLYRFRKFGLYILGAFFTASVLIPGLIIHFMNLQTIRPMTTPATTADRQMDFFNHVYIKPWCRMGPYLVGIIFAVILHKTTLKPKLPPMVVAIGWTLATVTGFALVFGTHDYITGDKVMTNVENSIYGACSRQLWAVVTAWVVFACVTGHGGFVNTFLSWKALVPLSRLTYTTYLIHVYLLITFYGSQENIFYFTHYFLILIYLGMMVISMALAFIYSLAFESPLIELEKIFLPRRSDNLPPDRLYGQQGSSHIQISPDDPAASDLLERRSRKNRTYDNRGFEADHENS